MNQDQTEKRSENGPFPRLKAVIGSYCIHCGLTTFLLLLLMLCRVSGEIVVTVFLWYFLVGWIPVAIWIYPVLKRKLRWI